MIPIMIPMTVEVLGEELPMTVTDNSVEFSFSVGIGISVNYPLYDGEYEFTPTQSTQTVQISGKAASQDIIINPIPSNYGLITWNGSVLTVS